MSTDIAQAQRVRIKGLLPVYFKAVGLFILLFCLLQAIAFNVFHPAILTKDESMSIVKYGVLLGLLFIGWAQHKKEEPSNLIIRAKALTYSVLTSILFVIVNPVIDKIMDNPQEAIMGTSILTQLLLMYIFAEWTLRKGLIKVK